ncbi:glutathione peroxidase [Moraxella atlantae]|uniref:glutathione peroxidase n=1 Tax=Faucicola atlantae TaxID=34059 RepID=UPI0037502155
MNDFYQLSAKRLNGQTFDFAELQGKVVLIVNTASKCGFTPQYAGLEELYQRYHDQGLVVIGFPCNQFGGQEPGDADQISEFCQVNYGVSFPMMAKVAVNGANTHPVFDFLKRAEHGKGMLGDAIKWNFTKFLVDQHGNVVKRYAPTTAPADIASEIERLLNQ